MKALKEIRKIEYESGRDVCTSPEDVEDRTDAIFIARFWTSEEQIALEGLVSVKELKEEEIDFQQVNDDGELIGSPYAAHIDTSGIIGAITLRDGRVLHAQEGYLMQYGDTLDDELADMIAQRERELVPVHVTLGGLAGDIERQKLVH